MTPARFALSLSLLAAGCASQGPAGGGPLSPRLPSGEENSAPDRESVSDVRIGNPVTRPDETDAEERYGLFRPAPLGDALATGRPSFATGTGVVPEGRLQLEFGYLYTEDFLFRQQAFPGLLVRYGIYDDVELRLSGVNYLERDDADGADTSGFADLILGVKFVVREQNGLVPAVVVLPTLALPTGSADRSDQIDPGVQFAVGWNLTDTTSLLSNLNTLQTSVGTRTTPVFGHSLAIFQQFRPPLPHPFERPTLFVEHFAVYPDGPGDAQNLDFGLLLPLGRRFQADVFGGVGLNGQANDWFAGVGFAVAI